MVRFQRRDHDVRTPSIEEKAFDTRAIRAGQVRTPEGEHNDPVFMTSRRMRGLPSSRQAMFIRASQIRL